MKTELSTPSVCGKDLSLHTVHWAAKTPRAVMSLVHGLGEHSGRYADMAAHLNEQGISVLAIDLRGHGQSDGPRGICQSYDNLISDLTCLLAETKRLYPTLPHFLFGHSMGGGLVLHYALNHEADIKGYLVSAPLIKPTDPISKPLATLVRTLRKILPRGAITNSIPGSKISSLPKQQAIYETDPYNHSRLGFGLAVDIIEAGEHIEPHAKQWNKPLHLWHSRIDKLTSFEASEHFAALAENCTFTAFDKVEHEMHNDTTRDEIYALMTQFILQEASH